MALHVNKIKVAVISATMLVLVLACRLNSNSETILISNDKLFSQTERLSELMIEFEAFRTAVSQRSVSKTKRFFNFPLEGNDIWYKVIENETLLEKKLNTPFTERDFDKYFDVLFPKAFQFGLSKVDTKQLSDRKSTKTIGFKSKENVHIVTSYMTASYTGESLILTVNSTLNDTDNQILAEHQDFYCFRFENKKLIFEKFYMAG